MDEIKILVVEDEHFLSTILANRLKKEGFIVNQVYDGQEAVDFLATQKADLIILDIILPKKSGFEVLETISRDPQLSQIPVIILSNLGQQSDIEKARDLGAFAYYIKVSTSIDNFVEVVRNVIESARAGQNPQIAQ